jgi:hypothetical protein
MHLIRVSYSKATYPQEPRDCLIKSNLMPGFKSICGFVHCKGKIIEVQKNCF